MPRLRIPRAHSTSAAVTQDPPDAPSDANKFKKGHKKLGGRVSGQPNVVTRSVRESIIAGLNAAGGPQGMAAYVTRVALEDPKLGVAMMALVCPKAIEATVRHEDQVLLSVEQLDESLRQAGLPPSKEIFALDFKGTSVPEPEEAEVVDERSES